MPKTNPIRRGVLDQDAVFAAGAGVHSPGRRVWYAVCPDCMKKVMHPRNVYHYADATRKNTRDALYRHVEQQHKPGLVGR